MATRESLIDLVLFVKSQEVEDFFAQDYDKNCVGFCFIYDDV